MSIFSFPYGTYMTWILGLSGPWGSIYYFFHFIFSLWFIKFTNFSSSLNDTIWVWMGALAETNMGWSPDSLVYNDTKSRGSRDCYFPIEMKILAPFSAFSDTNLVVVVGSDGGGDVCVWGRRCCSALLQPRVHIQAPH